MKKKITQITSNGIKYTFLNLPGSEVFKYEVVQKVGSNIERIIERVEPSINKSIYGISHLIEHLSFKKGKDFTTSEITSMLKKYGVYNASTDFDHINYYYQGTMTDINTIVKLVNNIAFNDLTKVPKEEFVLERDVVFNEAKLYYDDDHSKFSFDETTHIFGLHINDNVLGSLETIKGIELEECIKIKAIMNIKENQSINIVFDGTLLTSNEIIEIIEADLLSLNLKEDTKNILTDYKSGFPSLSLGEITIYTEAEQTLYSTTFQIDENRILVNKTLNFLTNFSKHSLTEEVREKRGLTYHIGSGSFRVGQKDYYSIHCNITKGNEITLEEAITIAIDKTLDELTDSNFEDFMKSSAIKRKLSLLNLNSYSSILWDINENKLLKDKYAKSFAEDIDKTLNDIDSDIKVDDLKRILLKIKGLFKNNDIAKSWGKNDKEVSVS